VIGRLQGEILSKHPPVLLLDVHGVGYEVEAPMSTFYDLPAVGEKATLFTHLSIREDAHVLYGFVREADRSLFRALLRVSGVGGKMALAILSGMTADEFSFCVHAGDVAALTRVPGVGKKTAERLIVEMRDRLENVTRVPGTVSVTTGAVAGSPLVEATSALVALGYKPADASRMVKGVAGEDMASEQIIRAALQSVAKG
jgi:Holliday junction DNA helicase RuvA